MSQLAAPPILPFPGPNGNQLLQFWHSSPPAGDAVSAMGTFVANGNECKVPQYILGDKFSHFAEKCPPEKFLNSSYPDCSCANLHASFDDFAVVMVKSGGTFFSGFGNGSLYPYIFLCILIVLLVVICAPFVYFFSYRMSRNEIKDTHRPDFFLKWHRQRLSSLICLVLVSFGFALFFMHFVGSGTTLKINDWFEISTAYPGLVMALLGILVWMKILNNKESATARRTTAVEKPARD